MFVGEKFWTFAFVFLYDKQYKISSTAASTTIIFWYEKNWTWWTFFNDMRVYKLNGCGISCKAWYKKTRVQMIYNELKCGLHANTQKYHATCPPKKAALSGNASFNL